VAWHFLIAAAVGLAAGDDVPLDTAEAEVALAVVQAGESAWKPLQETLAYQLLRKREQSMGRSLVDDDMRALLTAPATAAMSARLAGALAEWKARGLGPALALAHAYLPAGTPIRARVFIVIKPRPNSFVFEGDKIFLYLDPSRSPAQFENTVAHELHHIGMSAACGHSRGEGPKALARSFAGAFGEGFAMLAAAGGPDVHPHAVSPPQDRARWDRDLTHFDADLRAVERFLLEILDGRIASEQDAMKVAAPFWGEQGAWYTVGWKMAVTIERRFGRARLIADECNPAALFQDYNQAADPAWARFSADLLQRLQ
jgi:hypothetical protein